LCDVHIEPTVATFITDGLHWSVEEARLNRRLQRESDDRILLRHALEKEQLFLTEDQDVPAQARRMRAPGIIVLPDAAAEVQLPLMLAMRLVVEVGLRTGRRTFENIVLCPGLMESG